MIKKNELSPHNLALLNNFHYHLKVEKGLSQNSLESYGNDISDFLIYLKKDAEKIVSSDVIDYFVGLQEIGLAASSIARKRSAIRTFYKFLEEEEIEISLEIDDIPAVKYSQNLPDVLSVREMMRFLENIPTDNPLGIRNKAMFELMYASGLRISETINLTIHNIYWQEKIVNVMGKGGKQRLVPIAEKSLRFVENYFKHARVELLKDKESDIMFLNRFGNKMSRMGVWKII
ncbi:MAG: tyrosine recombinase, partial [Candidatus Cloacimonadota bacterium]